MEEWTNLPTNHTDAVWTGLKKYIMIENGDGTVSLSDVTAYTNREDSFFGSAEVNKANGAINDIMANIDNIANAVPNSRKVNNKPLSSDIALTANDVGAAPSSHNHAASNITSGTLPLNRGGTGASSAADARANLGTLRFIEYIAPSSGSLEEMFDSFLSEMSDRECCVFYAEGGFLQGALAGLIMRGTESYASAITISYWYGWGYWEGNSRWYKDNGTWHTGLTPNDYGTSLPTAGKQGRLFFKKA